MKAIPILAIALLLLFAGCTSTPAKVDEWKGDDGRWYRGARDAKVTILEYSDFQCPYCGKVQPTIDQVLSAYGGKVKISFRNFPLEQVHPYALKAAIAAECAGGQGKYWQMHDILFSHQDALTEAHLISYAKELGLDEQAFISCLNSEEPLAIIDADISAAEEAGVQGTPTFVINNAKIVGAEKFEKFSSTIDVELARTK